MQQFFLAALIQAAAPLGASAVDPGRLPALVDSLAALELRAGPTAGVSVAVMQGGVVLFARGYGYADLENPAAVNLETIFKVGSVTKQVTTVLLGQLVDQGKVDLDADIRTYLPDAPTSGRPVTIAQLLNHTSGIRSFTNLGPAVSRDSFRLDLTTDRLIGLLRNVPPDFEPGTSWQYNNTGYLIAGMLVEKVTGMSLAEVLARQITGPLGLTRTSWCDERAIVPNRAKGYRRAAAGFERAVGESMWIPRGAGALCSTPVDLVRFRDALAKGKLLSRATYERMITPALLADGWKTNYGYGVAVYHVGPHRIIRHGGTITGFQANLLYVPERDLVVSVLANTMGSDPVGLSDRLVAGLLGAAVPVAAEQTLPADRRAAFTGRYRLAGTVFEVKEEEGRLMIGRGGGNWSRLAWQGDDRFLALGGQAFGFYGQSPSLRLAGSAGRVSAIELDHPVDGPMRGQRVE